MAMNANDIRLVIHLEGGIVQAVYSDSGTPVKVAIQDLDIDGADQDEMAMLDDGAGFVGHIEPVLRNDHHVSRVFAALGEEAVATDKRQEDYVRKNGCICPHCGSEFIESIGCIEADGAIGFGDVECRSCKSTWQDQYALAGFGRLEAEPLNVSPSG